MNLGGALEAPAEGDWGYVIEKQHLDRLATDGFDAIRLPVKFSQYWDGTAMDLALMARVDQVIGWATRAGLNVILDLHHFEELMQDPDAHSANFIAMWAYLSDYYVDHSDKLIFELLNEPTEALTTDKAVALYQKIIADLRVDHPTRWVITGGDNWNAIEPMLTMPQPSPYEVRTFHYYSPWHFTHQQASYLPDPPPARDWGTDADLAQLQADFDLAATGPAPLFLGEFGVFDATDPDQKTNWVRAVRNAAEARGIGWCYWGLSQGGAEGFSAFDVIADDWIPGMYEALME